MGQVYESWVLNWFHKNFLQFFPFSLLHFEKSQKRYNKNFWIKEEMILVQVIMFNIPNSENGLRIIVGRYPELALTFCGGIPYG